MVGFEGVRGRCPPWSVCAFASMATENPKGLSKTIMKICRDSANQTDTTGASRSQQVLLEQWQCPECNDICKSRQALAVHRAKRHQWRRPERLFVDSTTCPVCLVDFQTRTRVINHIAEKSAVCRLNIVICGTAMSIEQADALDADERERVQVLKRRGLRAHHVEVPCCRVPGPLNMILPLPTDDAAAEDRQLQNPLRHHPLGIGRRWEN